ncbi:response regulator [Bradyrhizobium japonicum]|nr:response regulator [Bradyrhizobium japonicum]
MRGFEWANAGPPCWQTEPSKITSEIVPSRTAWAASGDAALPRFRPTRAQQRRSEQPAWSSSLEPRADRRPGLKILLVEDEPLILLDVEDGLQQADHTVISVCNADRAIDVLRTQAVDLILTDIDMPGSMDGLKLAAAVRDRWPPVKIVIMSGKRRPTDEELPTHARFIPKPFSQAQLLSAVGVWS